MKREQKAFAMMMAACIAFAGISTISTASAVSPESVSFRQVQLGNYLPDEESKVKELPDEIVLPSGRKVIKKSSNKTAKKSSVVKEAEAAKTKKPKVIKAKRNVTEKANQERKTLSTAARN